MLYLYSYMGGSNGAKEVAKKLKVNRIKHKNSSFKGGRNKIVINWGATEVPKEVGKCTIINTPEAVKEVSNKLLFFEKLNGKKLTPTYTRDARVAEEWLKGGYHVLCRTLLRASGGRGIVLDKIVEAKLYVRYIAKKEEYRVHIFRGQVIDVQRKARKLDEEQPNWKIRNLEGGFVYVREGFNIPECVIDVAKKTFKHFNLDFGAIDIIYTANKNRAFALEINTAPGLEGQTVESYVTAFKAL